MGFEAFRRYHAVNGPIGLQKDLAFGKIEVEWLPFGTRTRHCFVGGVEGAENRFNERLRDLIGAAADRQLCLLVGKARRRTHHDPMERVRSFAAVGADHHPNCQRRAVFMRAQRAEIIRYPLRQHRHHTVGKVDRIAARERFAVESRARPYIVSDVGNGHVDDKSATIVRCRVGLGLHRIVVILGIRRVDRDERNVPPVLATTERRRRSRIGLLLCLASEDRRDAVRVNGDDADGALALQRSQSFNHAAGRQAEAWRARRFDGDQVAVLRHRRWRQQVSPVPCRAFSCRPAPAGRRHARSFGKCPVRGAWDGR